MCGWYNITLDVSPTAIAFNPSTNNITLDVSPNAIAVNPNNDLVYVTNSLSDSVSIIDGKTGKVLPTNVTVGD